MAEPLVPEFVEKIQAKLQEACELPGSPLSQPGDPHLEEDGSWLFSLIYTYGGDGGVCDFASLHPDDSERWNSFAQAFVEKAIRNASDLSK